MRRAWPEMSPGDKNMRRLESFFFRKNVSKNLSDKGGSATPDPALIFSSILLTSCIHHCSVRYPVLPDGLRTRLRGYVRQSMDSSLVTPPVLPMPSPTPTWLYSQQWANPWLCRKMSLWFSFDVQCYEASSQAICSQEKCVTYFDYLIFVLIKWQLSILLHLNLSSCAGESVALYSLMGRGMKPPGVGAGNVSPVSPHLAHLPP